ncbi:MAG: glycine-rich protein [Bacteroidota bacterium]
MKRKIYKLLSVSKQSLFAFVLTVFLGTAYSQTYTLNYTGSAQTQIIPTAGIWGIECWGADGGDVTAGPGGGGKGGYSKGAFTVVTPGTVLNVLIGGKGGLASGTGGPAGNGGWNGGGGGGYCGRSGGGGGGATDVRVGGLAATNRIIVAGGGGGAAYYSAMAPGGNGGATLGQNGDFMTSGNVLTVGGGGSGANGGSAGVGGTGYPNTDGNVTGGGGGGHSPGGFGQPGIGGGAGGAGGSTASGATGGSGGGGGGFAGGAGGTQTVNAAVGGGGGSGYVGGVNNGITVSVGQTGFVANTDLLGNGMVIITRLCNISLVPSQNPICIGGAITLTTDAMSGISWGNSSSTGNSISVSPTVTTTYSVTGTSTANCITSMVITVTVHPLPVIGVVATPTTLCVGNTATVTANGASTYVWASGNSAPASTTVNPVVNSIYIVTGTSIYGCVNTQTAMVNVNTNTLTMVPQTTSLCIGSTANITASGAVTYTWSNGVMFASIPVSPTVNTTYVVSAIDIHNCVISNTMIVVVSPLPSVTISTPKTLVCKGESVTLTGNGAATYTWSNGFVGAALTTTLPVDVPYYFSVTGTDLLGCKKSSNLTINVSKCVGINETNDAELAINLLPNPGPGLFSVRVEQVTDHLNMKVYNELGMLVKTQDIASTESKLDLQNEKSGIYFVRISDGESVLKVVKLIKE